MWTTARVALLLRVTGRFVFWGINSMYDIEAELKRRKQGRLNVPEVGNIVIPQNGVDPPVQPVPQQMQPMQMPQMDAAGGGMGAALGEVAAREGLKRMTAPRAEAGPGRLKSEGDFSEFFKGRRTGAAS